MDTKEKIVMMKRIGQLDIGSTIQSRKLLVVLDSESTAAELLNRAHLLRDVHDPQTNARIYINRDLSPEESKAAYERRQQRRQLQQGTISEPRTERGPQSSVKVYYRSTANKPSQARNYQPAGRQEYRGGWARQGSTWWKPGRGDGGGEVGRGGGGRWVRVKRDGGTGAMMEGVEGRGGRVAGSLHLNRQ